MVDRGDVEDTAVRPGASTRCSLDALATHEQAVIAALSGGHGLVGRLAALGFVPGAQIKMLQNYGHGPLIVLVRQARVALGRGEALKITVTRAGVE